MQWPKVRNGFTEMGRVRVPPQPQYMILTDRTTGVQWHVTYEASRDHVIITDTLPRTPDKRVYEAFEEPYLGKDPKVRLIVSDSHLGYEYEDGLPQGIQDRDNAALLLRRAFNPIWIEIRVPEAGLIYEHGLAWEETDD